MCPGRAWWHKAKPRTTARTSICIEFIQQNREKLVLKPNDDYSDQHSFFGWEMDDAAWERALKQALRRPYVVQEKVDPVRAVFPVYQLRQPGVPRDAGGRASARISRQSAGMLELDLDRRQFVQLHGRASADLHPRRQKLR